MHIVVITGKAHYSVYKSGLDFSVQTVKHLAEKNSGDKFIIAGTVLYDNDMILPGNAETVLIKPGLKERLLGKQSAGKISGAALKKLNAERVIVIESNGMLKSSLPQFHLITKAANFKKEKISNNAGFGFFSENEKKNFLLQTGIGEKKCRVIPPAPSDLYKVLPAAEKIKFREKVTGGKDYFFVYATDLPADDFTVLLKAFSVFKKRQQSGFKLLISHTPGKKGLEILENYKYRRDVLFLPGPGHVPEATAAAYGVIVAPAVSVSSVIYTVSAMQAGAPLILTAGLPVHEITAGSFLLADEWHADQLAGHLMRLYTDEGMRTVLAEKAMTTAAQLDWDKTAGALWQAVQETVG